MTTPADDPDDPLAQVTALGDQLLRLQRRRRHVYDGTVLENSAFRLLWVLADGEPRTLRRLATDLDLEQSTVNRQVNAAIAAGWLERFEVEGSASRLVRPTAAGTDAFRHDGLVRATAIRAALDALGPERAAVLVDLLGELNDAWDAAVVGVTGSGVRQARGPATG
ncbi:MarR family winged helix-turn-helix transcriptional regulator [Nocardioides litoris]|uniref:MarR family winged helix-turn-helix transcriptional regulator n=1 Tax=Nocardioides litoris TaxID=1926648 RepID=UPI00111ECFA5|nr:MarR family winged helix-turn-helix transcriptional regulator [Nocardioides litoris]